MIKHDIHSYIATWCGSGNAPFAPGTFGSLAALPLGYIIHVGWGASMLVAMAVLTFAIGTWSTHRYMHMHGTENDPKEVVIDEVSGQWLMLAVVPPTLLGYALGFILFRGFDIIKPWPISWLDRKLHNAFGVMIDDTLAAIMGIAVYMFGEVLLG